MDPPENLTLRERLKANEFFYLFSGNLKDTINGNEPLPTDQVYQDFPVNTEDFKPKNRTVTPLKSFRLSLPKRITNALVDVPAVVIDFLNNKNQNQIHNIRSEVLSELLLLRQRIAISKADKSLRAIDISRDTDSYAEIATKSYCMISENLSDVADCLTRKFLNKELSIAAGNANVAGDHFSRLPKVYDLLVIMKKFCNIVSTLKETSMSTENIGLLKEEILLMKKNDDGSYLISVTTSHHKVTFILADKWLVIDDSRIEKMLLFTKTEFDYIITLAETMLNLNVISSCFEYNWAKPILNIITETLFQKLHHNTKVEFMKNFESLCLQMIDTESGDMFSWEPILGTVSEMHDLDQRLNKITYDIGYPLLKLCRKTISSPPKSLLCRMIDELRKLSPTQKIEISSVHKFCFYAIVNTEAGFMKLVKRCQSKRKVDNNAIERMCWRFSKEFIINYIKRHQSAPGLIAPDHKKTIITEAARTENLRSLESLALPWWTDVYAFDCINKDTTGDPIEFAKDKGAIKESIRYGHGDSIRELKDVITRTDQYSLQFDLNEFHNTTPVEVKKMNSLDTPIYKKYSTRLIAKEREQKPEARAFGAAPTVNKHKLSNYMFNAKKVLSYFDNQFMTTSNKSRNELFHDNAQVLSDPRCYAIMADIEGHNQSMQPHNVGPLARRIGLACGEYDWDKLTEYFSMLDIYMYDDFLDETFLTKGQQGGIEGWMGPIWGLHSVLMMEEFFDKYSIMLKFLAVYSDDICAIVQIDNLTTAGIEALYNNLAVHCSKYGMIIKASQTMISKHRITMLRRTYADGILGDSSLKRMFATSIFNNDIISSEELEMSSLNSTTTSALELTNHIVTPTTLKLYRGISCVLRSFASYFEGERLDSWLNETFLGKEIYYKLWPMRKQGVGFTKADHDTLVRIGRNDVLNVAKKLQSQLPAGSKLKLHDLIESNKLSSFFEMRIKDMIYLYLIDDDILEEALFLRLFMPQSLGGYGLSLLIHQSVRGPSDMTLMVLAQLKNYADNHKIHQNALHYALENILRNHHRINSKEDLTSKYLIGPAGKKGFFYSDFPDKTLCVSTWPANCGARSADSIVKNAVKRKFIELCINPRIKDIMKLDENREEFSAELVDIFRSAFNTRITQYYFDNSVFHIIDKLLKKVENTSSFLRMIKNIHGVREKLHKITLNNTVNFFTLRITTYGIIDTKTNMGVYMQQRRNNMYPRITFMDIIEPQYPDCFELKLYGNSIGRVMMRPKEEYKDGMKVFRRPIYGSEALYKGEIRDHSRIFRSIEERLIMQIVCITKWIIFRSILGGSIMTVSDDCNLIEACDLVLSTTSKLKYRDVEKFVPTTPTGEVMHRLPDRAFRSLASIGVLPFDSQEFSSVIDQSVVNKYLWHDSNLHFDYIRLISILMMTVRKAYSTEKSVHMMIVIKDASNIRDARIDFLKPSRSKRYHGRWIVDKSISIDQIGKRIAYITRNPSLLLGEVHLDMIPEGETRSAELNSTYNYVIAAAFTYKSKLSKEMMSISFGNLSMDHWEDFINRHKSLIPEWNTQSNTRTLEELQSILSDFKSSAFGKLAKSSINIKVDELRNWLLDEMGQGGYLEEVLDHFFEENIQLWQKIRGESILQNLRIVISQALKKMNSRFEDVLESFFRRAIVDICGIFKFDGNIPELDRDATYSRCFSAVYNPETFVADNPSLIKIMSILYWNLNEESIAKAINNSIQYISKLLSTCNATLFIILPETYKPENMKLSVEGIPNMVFLEQLECRYLDVGSEIFTDNDYLRKTLTFRSTITQVYCHPDVMASPTGSDTYAVALIMLRMMKKLEIIQPDDLVIDATAGRGDFNCAMTSLNIKHRSHTMRTIFNMAYSTNDIILEENYDIHDINTCTWILDGKIIIIDISFVKNKSADLSTTIISLLNLHKKVILRLNSVVLNLRSIQTSGILNKLKMRLFYLSDGIYSHQNVYCLLELTHDPRRIDAPSLNASSWFPSFIRQTYSMIHTDNLFVSGGQSTSNSATILIDHAELNEEFFYDIVRDQKRYGLKKWIHKIITNIDLIKTLVLPIDELLKTGYSGQYETDQKLIDTVVKIYELEPVANRKISSEKAYNRHTRVIEYMRQNTKKLCIINALIIDDNTLKSVRNYHPILKVRSTCTALLNAKAQLESDFNGAPLRTKQDIIDIMEVLPDTVDQFSLLYRESIQYMIYFNDMYGEDTYLKYIVTYYANGGIEHHKFVRLMALSKKLSSRQVEILHRFKSIPDCDDLLREIYENFILPGQKAMLRRDNSDVQMRAISKRNDDIILEDVELNAFLESFAVMISNESLVKSTTINKLSLGTLTGNELSKLETVRMTTKNIFRSLFNQPLFNEKELLEKLRAEKPRLSNLPEERERELLEMGAHFYNFDDYISDSELEPSDDDAEA